MAQNQYAYNFSLFDSLDYGTSAPQIIPEIEPVKAPSRKKAAAKTTKTAKKTNVKDSASQKAASKRSALYSAVIMSVAVIVVALFAGTISLNSALDEKVTRINMVQAQIDESKSEQVRLESQLDSLVSIDRLDDYAVNVLGMVKLEDYKITYINNSEDNHVVLSGGKSYEDNSFSMKLLKIKEYFSR